jgi:hypothetical protein
MRVNSDTAWSIAAFNLSGDFAHTVRVQQHGIQLSANEELVAAFDAGLDLGSKNGDTLLARGDVFTDNGLHWMRRQRVYTPDDMFDWNVLAANTYPAVRGVICRDGVNQFSILTGRSMGVSLLAGNQMQLLLHRCCYCLCLPLLLTLKSRNTQTDDGRGLNEPLNVTAPLDDTQWLFWSPDSPDSDDRRTRIIQQINQPVVLGFAAPVATVSDYAKQHALQASFLLAPLPPSLHLQAAISLDKGERGAGRVLLRFMNSHASASLTFSLWHIIPEHAAALVQETRCCLLADSFLLPVTICNSAASFAL